MIDRRTFFSIGSSAVFCSLPLSAKSQDCTITDVFIILPQMGSGPADSLRLGAEAAAVDPEIRCGRNLNIISAESGFSGTLSAIQEISESASATGREAIVVGAFGEAIGAKYAATNPRLVYIDLLQGERRIPFEVPNYFALSPQGGADASNTWSNDLFQQGMAAVDLSTTMADAIAYSGWDSSPDELFVADVFADQITGKFNTYQLDPSNNTIFAVPN